MRATPLAEHAAVSAAAGLGEPRPPLCGANFEAGFHKGRPNPHKSNDQYFLFIHTCFETTINI